MKLIWLTDTHLNLLTYPGRLDFYKKILKYKHDAILLTGDIAEGIETKNILLEMVEIWQKPIYFVLGNHDYYDQTFLQTKKAMQTLNQKNKFLHWLPALDAISLNDKTVLIGVDGWADGRYANFFESTILLSDSTRIPELAAAKQNRTKLLKNMQALADADALCLEKKIKSFLKTETPKKIIVLTHIPPFPQAALNQGKVDSNWLPWMSSKATGDIILSFAKKYPKINFLVLSGHTHEKTTVKILPNLKVKVGKAELFKPKIAETLVINSPSN